MNWNENVVLIVKEIMYNLKCDEDFYNHFFNFYYGEILNKKYARNIKFKNTFESKNTNNNACINSFLLAYHLSGSWVIDIKV